MVLICFSLMVNDVEHLFMCLHFLFGKISNQVFCPFLNQILKKVSVFLATLSLCCWAEFLSARSTWGLLAGCGVQVSHCGAFSCGAGALGHVGFSRCSSWVLEHRLNSCGTQAYGIHSIWDLPGSGIESVSLVLAGRFSTTEPPGKPQSGCFVGVELYELFIYWGYQSLSSHIVCKCFLPFSRLSFCFVDGFLCCAKAFNFS